MNVFRLVLLALCALAAPGCLGAKECAYTGAKHKVLRPGLREIPFTLCEEHFALGSLAREAVDYVLAELNAVAGSSLRWCAR